MKNSIQIHNGRSRKLLIAVVAILIIAAVSYSFFTTKQMTQKYYPLVDATMEVKLEATTAHLWFEEIISGDRYENMESIMEYIDQAIWYAKAMLKGGQNPEGTFWPLTDVLLRNEVAQTIDLLLEFKATTITRYETQETSGVGSEIDQQYDRLFKRFLNQIDNVETLLQRKIERDYNQYYSLQFVLIITIILSAFFVFILQIKYEKEQKDHLAEINEAKERAERNEQWFKTTMNSMGDGVITTDHKGYVTYLNPVASSLTGWRLSEAKNKKVTEVFDIVNEETKKPVDDPISMVIRKNVVVGLANHTELISKDGTRWPISDSAAPIFDQSANLTGVVLVFHEITEQKKAEAEKEELEAQLRQAHKMDAIGTLAGGVAHDFNNILAAILGYAEMAMDDTPDDSAAKYQIAQVVKAGNRAKELVKQILAFSRKEVEKRGPVQIHIIVKEALKLLRSSIPTTIEITTAIDPACGNILANPTQIHQIVMNLCTNAAQAMDEDGGELKVEMINTELEEDDLLNEPELKPGPYVQLSVKDTGVGIDQEDFERIFDPYFTTKEFGKGTGMGLSVVMGIVKGLGGMITVESIPGKGSTFKVFFPKGEEHDSIFNEETKPLPTGKERILVVDDEKSIADMTKRRVERLGYQVTAKTSSLEALELFSSQPDAFDVVISDQTMPELTGENLARKLLEIRPDIPIIICTGYSSKIDAEKANFIGIRAFIMKPVDKVELAETIRSVLEETV